jgi:hypothetical protein
MTDREMPVAADQRSRERGQTLVIFAIAFIGIVAAMGLVLVFGGAPSPSGATRRTRTRRHGRANNPLTNHDTILAVSAARSVAHPTASATVPVV